MKASSQYINITTDSVDGGKCVAAEPPSALVPNGTAISDQKSSGVSPGAVAGIGIGCAITGAVAGFTLAWWMWRRHNGKAADTAPMAIQYATAPEYVGQWGQPAPGTGPMETRYGDGLGPKAELPAGHS